ncbi:hypothetical protein GPECTOR_19g371 [Gonium pectorale]|uniref:Uncharacterized protein n=1 Tax=Gonium pectorale TaxID=33097 RepID=A0A150GKP4_GONPE|nr:hypothetical protein GPECTOR_19g371 [Gonium pectorale]|eukprot:KXZ49920.1 hypothetical protein GPECTOR_19g371 [Gonium pectorale]
MAAYMALHKYGSPHQEPLRDPQLYDTALTREGLRRAAELGPRVAALKPRPQLVLVSPLSRCLQTAVAACWQLRSEGQVPLRAEPLLRERVTLSSEVGRPPGELRSDFPEVEFPSDMPNVWWYTGGQHGADPWVVTREPQDVYEARLATLRRLLAAQPERVVLLVSHWGVLKALTGRELQPAELASVQVELPAA